MIELQHRGDVAVILRNVADADRTDVMKITKIADGWLSRNAAREIGNQASGEIVRRTWKIGSRPRIAHTD